MENIFKQIKRYEGNLPTTAGEPFKITLKAIGSKNIQVQQENPFKAILDNSRAILVGKEYELTVKKYMTEKSSPTFDFMQKWNNDIPMPLVTMVGKMEKETRGMVYMSLHGQAKETCNCLACGRKLTNPISKLYGLGPECGGHWYINPFDSQEEFEQVKTEIENKMVNIKWSGWVIKSAIKEWKEIK